MNKKNLLLSGVLLAIISIGFAQPDLTKGIIPIAGDVFNYKYISGDVPNSAHTAKGAGITWDFSALSGTATNVSITFKSLAQIKNGNLYPKATVASQSSDGYYYYYSFGKDKYNNDGYFIEGMSDENMLAGCSSLKGLVFTKGNMPFFKLPMKYNDQFGNYIGDGYAGDFDGGIGTVQISGNGFSQYDSYGTLKLPGGTTFTNVIKITRTNQYVVTGGIIPNQSFNSLEIFWFSTQYKQPVCYYLEDGNAATNNCGALPKLYFFVSGPSLGIDDNLSSTTANIFPNPATNYFSVQNEGASRIVISNIQGKTLINKEIKDTETLDINALAKGIYLVEVLSKNNILHSKLIKE